VFQLDSVSIVNGHTIVKFHWTGIAHNAAGDPIDRNGNAVQQGTAGNVGGGGNFSGGYTWNLGGDPGPLLHLDNNNY
jgi:hypothetical protein